MEVIIDSFRVFFLIAILNTQLLSKFFLSVSKYIFSRVFVFRTQYLNNLITGSETIREKYACHCRQFSISLLLLLGQNC